MNLIFKPESSTTQESTKFSTSSAKILEAAKKLVTLGSFFQCKQPVFHLSAVRVSATNFVNNILY